MNGLCFLILLVMGYYYFNLYENNTYNYYFIIFIFIYLFIYNLMSDNPQLINQTLKGYHNSEIMPIYTSNNNSDELYFKYILSQKQNWRCMYCNATISNNNIKKYNLLNLNNNNILICPHCYQNINNF